MLLTIFVTQPVLSQVVINTDHITSVMPKPVEGLRIEAYHCFESQISTVDQNYEVPYSVAEIYDVMLGKRTILRTYVPGVERSEHEYYSPWSATHPTYGQLAATVSDENKYHEPRLELRSEERVRFNRAGLVELQGRKESFDN